MAARENQALQIAVMIFFLLVVLLAVMTYLFFKSSDERAKKNEALQAEVAKLEGLARKDQDQINKYKELMGFTFEDGQDEIVAKFDEDMTAYSVGFDGEAKNYRTLLQFLYNDKISITKRETAAKDREQVLKSQIAKVEGTKEQQIVEYKNKTEEIEKDVTGERAKFNAERQRITQEAESVAKQLASKDSEISNMRAKHTAQVKALSQKVGTLDQLNRQKTELLRSREEETFEKPDGQITWVNQGSGTVWINLGRADSLNRQTVFAVYPTDANSATLPDKKGSIEVTRIIDQHMAEAKILDSSDSNPLLPGDKIHSPVWNVGHRDSFALAGFMDVDGDGRSDRERVKSLIAINGGDIDCELLDNGDIKGQLKLNTRYMILGDPPTGKESNSAVIDNYSNLTGQAQQLGIETISLSKFISQTGWRPDQRTVNLGRGASASDFSARPAEGVQRSSNASTPETFRSRKRPATTF
ncbi:MAG: hypothetical protein KDA42_06505 [Planctomycetales bacterium]|nr:hypothetical protein [Planctomycetales bacterium]